MSQNFEIEPTDIDVHILCYTFPEVRDLLETQRLSPSFHLSALTVSGARDLLEEGGYSFHSDLEIPTDPTGQVDFEKIHEPIIERITEFYKPELAGLSDFKERYANAGSSEAIKGLMAAWISNGTMTRLGLIAGDYEGYTFEAASLGMKKEAIDTVPSLMEAGEPVEGRVWFVSNPSAVDGNWHNNEALQEFIEAGHDVVLDFAYGGLTTHEHPVDVSAPNIKAVLTSPSKIYGVFFQRLPGVCYSREAIGPLVSANLWFRSVPGMMDALALHEAFGLHKLPLEYKEKQLAICQALGEQAGACMKPSDAILIAHTDENVPPEYARFARGLGRTIRLSKLFAKMELHQNGEIQ